MSKCLVRVIAALLLMAPLARAAGGYATDTPAKGQCPVVFKTTADPHYQTLLKAVTAAKAYVDKITRFDKPGFVPRPEYVREMKRYGILDDRFILGRDPIDVYRTDRKYWTSFHYRPKKK